MAIEIDEAAPLAAAPGERIAVSVRRSPADRAYRGAATLAGGATFAVMGLIGTFLLLRGLSAFRTAGFGFFTEHEWQPDLGGRFGVGAVLPYTVQVAVTALVIAVPVAVLAALFITEYAPRRLRSALTTVVDLLAAVPSLIYGLWGFFFLQPRLVKVARWMADHLGFVPFFDVEATEGSRPLNLFPSSTFIAGVVVSLMVVPICAAVMREVFSQTPEGEKEGALALGGTRWGVVRHVVLPFGRGGIIGGAMLGLGRALGETIAVTLIISPVFAPKLDILGQGSNSIAALIALKFSESNEQGISALMAAGLTLFAITLVVNALASFVVARSRSGEATEI